MSAPRVQTHGTAAGEQAALPRFQFIPAPGQASHYTAVLRLMAAITAAAALLLTAVMLVRTSTWSILNRRRHLRTQGRQGAAGEMETASASAGRFVERL